MKSLTLRLFVALLSCALLPRTSSRLCRADVAAPGTLLEAKAFGVVGDGKHDDGPAIQRALDAATVADGRVQLVFPEAATVLVKTAADGYVLTLHDRHGLTIDGRGSTFVLDPGLRLLDLRRSSEITIGQLQIDYDRLAFVDGLVESVDADAGRFVVRVDKDQADRAVGGPTDQDDEQAYFAMLWNPGPFDLVSQHCWIGSVQATDQPGKVAVVPAATFHEYGSIKPGVTKISLPVPGIAHRVGPGPCIQVRDCRDIALTDIELWSAPWFGVHIMGCGGSIEMTRVNIRPKPGSNRLMSTWRDGFHIKANRGTLRFTQCSVTRTCDDAFNIATHASRIVSRASDTQLVVRQQYPLAHVPWQVGDTLVAADLVTRKMVGQAKVNQVEVLDGQPRQDISTRAPRTRLTLDRPLPALNDQSMIWSKDAANPDTIVDRCTIGMSCRFQSPVTLRDCQVTALLWFYAADIEGPFPTGSVIDNSTLRQGRGNPQYCLIVDGQPQPNAGPDANQPPRAIQHFTFTGNTILGGVRIQGVEHLVNKNNTFARPRAPTIIQPAD